MSSRPPDANVDKSTGARITTVASPRLNPGGLAGSDNVDIRSLATDLRDTSYFTESLSITPGDVDWYRIGSVAAARLRASAQLSDLNGNGSISASERLVIEVWHDPNDDAGALAVGTVNLTTGAVTLPPLSMCVDDSLYLKVYGSTTAAAGAVKLHDLLRNIHRLLRTNKARALNPRRIGGAGLALSGVAR